MAIRINVQRLSGPWRGGWALDLHTMPVPPLGELPGSGYQRTELGELLYQLKYRFDLTKLEPIAEAAADFLKTRWVLPSLAAMMPVPPSDLSRAFQPVEELAIRISQLTGLPMMLDYLQKTKATNPLKNIEDPASRKQQLQGVFALKDRCLAGKHVLVFDDLYRSGETLSAITNVLYAQGNVARVYVLAVTRTRTKR